MWWRMWKQGPDGYPHKFLANGQTFKDAGEFREFFTSMALSCQECWDPGFTEPIMNKTFKCVHCDGSSSSSIKELVEPVVDELMSDRVQSMLVETCRKARMANYDSEISLGETRRTILASEHLGSAKGYDVVSSDAVLSEFKFIHRKRLGKNESCHDPHGCREEGPLCT